MFGRHILGMLLVTLPIGMAHAIPVTMNFTATDVTCVFCSLTAPYDQVSGQFIWDASSVNSNINSLTAVSLTVDGYEYTLGELDFVSNDVEDLIYGTVDGRGVTLLDNDFFISWDKNTLTPFIFIFASTNITGQAWASDTFTEFTITAASVPEPATLVLMGVGLAALGFMRRQT